MKQQVILRCNPLTHWSIPLYYRLRMCSSALNFCDRYSTPQEAWDAIPNLGWFTRVDDEFQCFSRASALRVWRDFVTEIDENSPSIFALTAPHQIREIYKLSGEELTDESLSDMFYDAKSLIMNADNESQRLLAKSAVYITDPQIKRNYGLYCIDAIYSLMWWHRSLFGDTEHYRQRGRIEQLALNIIRRHHPLVPFTIEYFE